MSGSGRDIKFRIGTTGGDQAKRDVQSFGMEGRKAYNSIEDAAAAASRESEAADARVRKIGDAFKSAQASAMVFAGGPQWQAIAQAAQKMAALDAQSRAQASRSANFSQFMGVTADPKGAMAASSASAFTDLIDAQDAKAQASVALLQRVADERNAAFSQFMGVGIGTADSGKDSIAVFEADAKALADLEARTAALRAQIDPLGLAQNRLNIELREANDLFHRGAISQNELSQATLLANQRYKQTAQALGALGDGGRLANYQVVNLGYQLNDVFVSLASGQAPLRVFLQQGSQIAQIFSGSGRGVGSILKEIGERALAILTPFRLLGAGVVGAAAGAAYALDQWLDKQNALQQALSGSGRGSGAMASQVNAIAEETAGAAHISTAAAREIEEAFAGTGKVGVENFAALTIATKRFAATTGTDLGDAKKQMADAFGAEDLLSGIDKINQRVNFLDQRTRDYIRTLIDQGDRQGAVMATLEALNPVLSKATDNTTALGRAWHFVADGVSNYVESIGHVLAGEDLAEKIKRQQDQLAQGLVPQYAMQKFKERLAVELDEFRRIQQDAAAKRADALGNNASLAGGALATQLEPNAALLESLNKNKGILGKSLDAPEKLGERLGLTQNRYDAVTRAIGTLTDAQGKLITVEDIAIQKQELAAKLAAMPGDAAHAAQRRDIAEKEKALDLIGKVITKSEAEKEVKLAGAAAYNQSSLHIDRNSAEIDRNNKLIDAQTKGEWDLAKAYLVSGEAAARKEAMLRALQESSRDGVDAESRARQVLDRLVADEAVRGGQQIDRMTGETDIRNRLNAQLAAGTLAQDDYSNALQLELDLRPLLIAHAVASGKNYADLTQIIGELSKAYGDLNASQKKTAMENALAGQRDQLTILRASLGLLGHSTEQQNVILAQLREAIELRRQGINLQDAEAQARIKNAGLIEQETNAINRQRDAINGVQGATSSLIDDVMGVLGGDGSLGGALSSFGKDIGKQLLTLDLGNPLKNKLLGQNNATMGDVGGLGGFFSLLGGGRQDPTKGIPQDLARVLDTGGARLEKGIAGAFDGKGSDFVNGLGKVLESGAKDIWSLLSSVGGGSGDFLAKGATFVASLFHEGLDSGPVGAGRGSSRAVPASLFRNARRMHGGGLVGDERAIIAKDGEIVGWPGQMANAFGGPKIGGMAFAHNPTVIIQGGAGPAEVLAMKDAFEELNEGFERRVVNTMSEISRRT